MSDETARWTLTARGGSSALSSTSSIEALPIFMIFIRSARSWSERRIISG